MQQNIVNETRKSTSSVRCSFIRVDTDSPESLDLDVECRLRRFVGGVFTPHRLQFMTTRFILIGHVLLLGVS